MRKAITLMELIIAIALLGVIILGATSFDASSRQFLRASETKTQVLNEAILILDQISKDALTAIGDINNHAISVPGADGSVISIVQDSNGNGRRENSDLVVKYSLTGSQLQRQVGNNTATTLSNRIMTFTANAPVANTAQINLNLRFNPAKSIDTFTNPEVTTQSNVEVPAWSLR